MTEDIIEVPTYEGGDMCLKFDSEEAATAALEGYPGSIDIIGTIYKPAGNMLPTDQGEVPEMAPMDGFHVNVRHTRPTPELAAHQVFPLNPKRVWA